MRHDTNPVYSFIHCYVLMLFLQRTIVARNRSLLRGVVALLLTVSALASARHGQHADNDTLAVIGERVITAQQFARLYKEKLVTMGLTDNGEMRRGYLINLVDDAILIAEARNRKLDHTVEARAERDRLKVQELLNAYSTKHLSPGIKVTDADLHQLFAKMNRKVKVSHLYAPTKEKADRLYDALRRGKRLPNWREGSDSEPTGQKCAGS